MAADQFQNQLDWINRHTGDDRQIVGSAVAWQFISRTLNELVKHFNTITFGEDDGFRRDREAQLKKLIIGMVYELDDCLDTWAKLLRERDWLDATITDLKKAFKQNCRKVGLDQIRRIRDRVAFHLAESLQDPDEIVALYTAIDGIRLESLREIVTSAQVCGYAMRDKITEQGL